jgi:signal peptidase I
VSDKPVAPIASEAPKPAPAKSSVARQIIEFVATIAIAFLVAQAVRTWVLPTIQLGDQVLANKFVFRFRSPQKGDIVVFDNPMPQPGEETLIKRVIAVGGQSVDVKGGKVLIDGVALDEYYTYGQPSDKLANSRIEFPVNIPQGYLWLMGDNRTSSQDSRYFGPVAISAVHGQAFFTYWPLSRFGILK